MNETVPEREGETSPPAAVQREVGGVWRNGEPREWNATEWWASDPRRQMECITGGGNNGHTQFQ